MGGEEMQQDIGRLKEAVETLKGDLRATRRDIAEMKDLLAGMKGGARMLFALASAGAAIGAACTELVHYLHGSHP